jgi:hypothetical protein
MPSANLVDAYSSSLKILVFFPGLHLPKLQKPQKKKNKLSYEHQKTNREQQ